MPLLGTRGAASAKAFGFTAALKIYVFPSGTSTWTAPIGVTKLQTAVGKGQDGNYWTPNQPSLYFVQAGLSTLAGYTSTTIEATAQAQYDLFPSTPAAGAVVVNWTSTYLDTSFTQTSITNTYRVASGQVKAKIFNGSWGSSYTTPYTGLNKVYSMDNIEIQNPNGAATTGFSLTFPGGTAAPATLTTFTNVSITPGATYTIVNNGSLTITYY